MKKDNCFDCNKPITIDTEFEGQTYHHIDKEIHICDNCYCNSDKDWSYCVCCGDVYEKKNGTTDEMNEFICIICK